MHFDSILIWRSRYDAPRSMRPGRTRQVRGSMENTVMEAAPLPPWRQMPWKTYAIRDVSGELHAGQNVLAIEVVHYLNGGGNRPRVSQTPMNAVLYVEATDGTVELFKSTPEGWRAALGCKRELAGSRIRRFLVERSETLRCADFRIRHRRAGKSVAYGSRKVTSPDF